LGRHVDEVYVSGLEGNTVGGKRFEDDVEDED
jgi:hypothetical protein